MKTGVKLAIVFIIGLLVGAVAIYAAMPMLGPTAPGPGEEVEILVGGLFCTSGEAAAYGVTIKTASEIAIEDINEYLEKAGSPYRFTMVSADTGTTAEGTLKAITTLAETKGVKAVIGPGNSVEVGGIKAYCDANKIVSVAVSSSAEYCIPDDYIFRPFVTNPITAPPIAKLMWDRGITKLASIYRDDSFGRDLADRVKTEFEKLGGTVKEVKYMTELPDYASEVAQLNSIVTEFGVDEQTAVFHVTFESDGLNIYSHAATYPELHKVKWFGTTDSKRDAFLPPRAPPEIGELLVDVDSTGLFPINPVSDITKTFINEFKARTDLTPANWDSSMYDNAWILCLAIVSTNGQFGEPLKNAVPEVAERYVGASGIKALNDDGDLARTDLGVWHVVKTNGDYAYEFYEYYSATTESFAPWIPGAFAW